MKGRVVIAVIWVLATNAGSLPHPARRRPTKPCPNDPRLWGQGNPFPKQPFPHKVGQALSKTLVWIQVKQGRHASNGQGRKNQGLCDAERRQHHCGKLCEEKVRGLHQQLAKGLRERRTKGSAAQFCGAKSGKTYRQHIPGRGQLGTFKIWNGQIWCGENLAPILKSHGKIWYKFPDCSTRTSMDREWGLLFPMGLWLVAAISYSISIVA